MNDTKPNYTSFGSYTDYPFSPNAFDLVRGGLVVPDNLSRESQDQMKQEVASFKSSLRKNNYDLNTIVYQKDFASALASTRFLKYCFDKESLFLSFKTYNADSLSNEGYNWLPDFKLVDLGLYQGLPVISPHSKQLFDQFDNFLIAPFDSDVTRFYTHARYDRILAEIPRMRLNDSDFFTSQKSLLHSFLWNHSGNAINFESSMKVIETPSPCSRSDYSFNLKNLTVAQLNKNSGAFVPVLVPVSYFSPYSEDYIQGYFFTFYYNLPLSKVLKYQKARRYISKFIKTAFTSYGAGFYDQKLANTIRNFKVKSYIDEGYPYNIAELLDGENGPGANLQFLDHQDPIPSNLHNKLFSKVTYPKDLLAADQKYKIKKERYTSFLKTNDLNDSLSKIINFSKRYKRTKDQIRSFQESIENLQERLTSLQKEKSEVYGVLNNFTSSLNTFYNVSASLNEMKEGVELNKSIALQNAVYSPDQSYINLMENYDILKITLIDSAKQETTYDFSNHDFTLDLLSNRKISSLTFSTKMPSEIKVVGLTNYSVVGGPYVIQVTKAPSLRIALKDNTSFYGVSDSTAYIHPHTASSTLKNVYNFWSSACLGEASSLLYKAFLENDLKKILIVCNLWITSAYKRDVWGKNFTHFTPYEDYLQSLEFDNEDYSNFEYPSQKFVAIDPTDESLTFVSSLPPPLLPGPALHEVEAPIVSYSPLVPRESEN